MNSDLKLFNEICESEEIISKIYNESIKLMKEDYLQYKKRTTNEESANNVKDNQYHIEHPLDADIISKISDLSNNLRDDDDDYRIFIHIDKIKSLWCLLIEKSIKCLRFFDKREPFIENSEKQPIAYGVKELYDFFDEYVEFENLLYGGGKYYRDHVVHMLRVWMLGIHCMLDKDNNGEYLKKLYIGSGLSKSSTNVTSLEKISIWTMMALTHDLGYPLEKSQQVIEKTKEMMKSFVANPMLSLDLSFNGVQNNMNDFVLRFISSKMISFNSKCPKESESPQNNRNKYVARLQPKYYFKFQKSLEQCMHGTISALVIYKLLIYFLESDFNINEDYQFDEEDARQFYIRREILRSIASHTCTDVYHLDMCNFAFFLIIMDDSQDWGRKRISELYVKSKVKYDFGDIVTNFDKENDTCQCSVNETFTFPRNSQSEIEGLLQRLKSQYKNYKTIFRDGQDTSRRNFDFIKECKILTDEEGKPIFNVKLNVPSKKSSNIIIELSTDASAKLKNVSKTYNEQYFKSEKIFGKTAIINKEEQKDKIVFTIEFSNENE